MSFRSILVIAGTLALGASAVACAPPPVAPPPIAPPSVSPTTPPEPEPLSKRMPPSPPPAVAVAPAAPPNDRDSIERLRRIYRFDFVLNGEDGATTSFTMNLEDGDHGEVVVGKNVALSAATRAVASASGSAPPASPRQDVGLKVKASFAPRGDDVLLRVDTEMSSFDAPSSTIRKTVADDDALLSPGKSALVTSIDEDHKHLQLTVVATRLR